MANEYFGKISDKGIQIIPVVISTAAIGQLVTLVGVILSSAFQATTKSFLCKKVHINLVVTGLTSGDACMIGINGNDSGIAGGYAATVIADLLDPNNRDAYLTAEEVVKTVWHETTSIVLGATTAVNHIDKWVSVGGGKGIPSIAGDGPELHAFNPMNSTLASGGVVDGVVTYYGVWMED